MTRRARGTDPATSWAAAFKDAGDKPLRELIVLLLGVYGPLTHDQLITEVKRWRPASESGVRTRVRELVDSGHVEQVPDMIAKSRYGRASLLWRVVQ